MATQKGGGTPAGRKATQTGGMAAHAGTKAPRNTPAATERTSGADRPQLTVIIVVAALAVATAVAVSWARTKPAAGGAAAAETWIWNDPAGAKSQAAAQNKPILVDFWASWCVWCKKMDDETYPDPRVRAALRGYVLLKIDVDKMPAFQKQFDAQALPTTVVLSPSGKEIGRAVGYQPAQQFVAFLADPRTVRR